MLGSLARVLRLTEDERRYLHTLAHGAAGPPRPLVGDVTAEQLVRGLVQTAEHSPFPVYGLDVYCDLIAWNRAATTYYTDFAQLPEGGRNMLRWLLQAPEARLRALVDELRTSSPDFDRWWVSGSSRVANVRQWRTHDSFR